MDVVLISDHPMTLGVQFLMTHLKDQVDLNVSCRIRGILASSTDFSRIECPYTVAERENLENYLGKTKPEIVGISTIERTRGRSMLLLPAIRKILPNAFFLAGGVDAIAAPHFYLDNGIDGVAMGDGETVMEAVLKRRLNGGREALMSRVPGMITRQHPSSDPASTPDVLPMPYYGEDLLYLGQDGLKPWVEDDTKDHVQFVNRKRAIDMYTQRGCTHKCAFCAQDLLALYGKDSFRNSRRRPVEDVVRYIGSVKSNYPQKQFVYFWDLDFLRKPRAELFKFAELYRSQIGLPFFVFVTEKSVNAAGLEILTALVSAGLRTINMGIQSGNSRVLKGYNRLNTPQESESAIAKINEATKNSDIEVLYDVITYNPAETREEIIDTIRLIMRIPTNGGQVIRLSTHKLSFNTGQAHSKENQPHSFEDYQDFKTNASIYQSTQSPYLSWLLGQMMRGKISRSAIGSVRRDYMEKLLDESYVATMDEHHALNQVLYEAVVPRDNEAFL